MRKIFAYLLLVLVFTSCNTTKNTKEFNENELEPFDGYVVISASDNQATGAKTLGLKNLEKDFTYNIEVSDKTFKKYKLNDTIHFEKPNTMVVCDTCIMDSLPEITTIIEANGHEYVLSIRHNKNCKYCSNGTRY